MSHCESVYFSIVLSSLILGAILVGTTIIFNVSFSSMDICECEKRWGFATCPWFFHVWQCHRYQVAMRVLTFVSAESFRFGNGPSSFPRTATDGPCHIGVVIIPLSSLAIHLVLGNSPVDPAGWYVVPCSHHCWSSPWYFLQRPGFFINVHQQVKGVEPLRTHHFFSHWWKCPM